MNKRGQNRNFSLCNFSSKNRRGSHVDVIISFVIFISFIAFLYILLQPTLTLKQSKQSSAESLETSLINNLSNGSTNNLTIISLSARVQGSLQNCVKLTNFLGNANIGNTITIRNSTNYLFTVYNSSSDIYIDVTSGKSSSYLFTIYYSPSFNAIPAGTLNPCNNLQQGSSQNSYAIGQAETVSSLSQNVFDFNVRSLINTYNNNYDYLKSWFNVSPSNNFGFNFTYQNQTSIGTKDNIPQFSEVYSEAFPILYTTGNSSLQSGLLTVRIW
jgi:hypothetical protein